MKHFIILILSACLSLTVMAQEKRMSWTVSENNVIGFSDDYSSNIISGDISGLYNLGKFRVGAGIGLGMCDPVKYSSMWKIEEEKSESGKFLFSLYARAQFAFTNKPNHLLIGVDLGENITGVDDYDGKSFNPYGFFGRPHVGAEFSLGDSGLNLFVLLGIHAQKTQTDEIKMEYSQVLKKYTYSGHEKEANSFAGLFLGVGLKF